MFNEIEELSKLGLTEGESKVYLALTQIGLSTAGDIVKKSGVAYSNIYDVLRRLTEKGIVSFITKNKTKHFQAVSPSNLADYLEKKEREISKQKEALKTIIPKLEKLQETAPKQDAEVFIGIKGLKTAFLKLIANQKNEHLFLYTDNSEIRKDSDLFFLSIKDELEKRIMKGITNQRYKGSKYTKQSKMMQLRFIESPLPGYIDVCGNKTLIVSWKKPMIAILIESEEISNNMKEYFYELWENASQ